MRFQQIFFGVFTCVLTIVFGVVHAADEWKNALPGEPLYEAKKRIENAELNAAVDPLKRADIYVQHAEERLQEIQELSEHGKTDNIGDLTRKYESAIENAGNEIEKSQQQGKDVSQALQTIESRTSKHTEVLTGLLGIVPDDAAPAIEHAIEVSKRGIQTAAVHLNTNQAKLKQEKGLQGKTRQPGFDREGLHGKTRQPGFDREGLHGKTRQPGFDRDSFGTARSIGSGIDRGTNGGFGDSRPGSTISPGRGAGSNMDRVGRPGK